MSKKIDIKKAHEILSKGFVLPAEVEAFFIKAKNRAVETMLKARAAGMEKLAKFDAESDKLWDSMTAEQKMVRDVRAVLGGFEYFTRPLRKWEWHMHNHGKLIKEIPFYGRSDADAVRLTEEDCDYRRIGFIIKVHAITGEEVTGAALHIDPASGDVNGTIAGKTGTASVKTIGAGGYNIQCYHFRCLVREVKRPAE